MDEYTYGYFYYTIRLGDTLYKISNIFGTTPNRIIVANPNINPNNLIIGSTIIVPVGNIVNTMISYNSNVLDRDIQALKTVYPFLEIGTIGRSIIGKPIYYIRIGVGPKEIFYNAAFHANEWITTPLLMKFTEEYSKAIANKTNIYNNDAVNLFYNTSLYIVPMVNPDGVDLVTGSLLNVDNYYLNAGRIAQQFPNIPFPDGWKANIRGVDLNLQFPAEWNKAKEIKYNQGFNKPAPRDFVGYGPLTEPESLAVYNFTLAHNFRLVIAYHTQGKEIYWSFQDYEVEGAEKIGNRFSQLSGYTLANPAYNSSFAGYKDWFIQDYRRPGYTIEAGIGSNPLPISQFSQIYQENIGILVNGLIVN